MKFIKRIGATTNRHSAVNPLNFKTKRKSDKSKCACLRMLVQLCQTSRLQICRHFPPLLSSWCFLSVICHCFPQHLRLETYQPQFSATRHDWTNGCSSGWHDLVGLPFVLLARLNNSAGVDGFPMVPFQLFNAVYLPKVYNECGGLTPHS